jgi:HAD superfamily hydrolase (TIGR01509 family)
MYGILFDCDGVLVDSERWSCGAWIPVLKTRGIRAELADIEVFLGQSDAAVLAHYARQTGQELPDELIAEKEATYFELARGTLQTFPGLFEVLDRLDGHGIPVAVASSGRPHKIRFSLQQVGLSERFAAICSASEVSRGKPAPDLFIYAAKQLDISPDRCLVIEDSSAGIQAARAAGMIALGYSSSLPRERLLQAGAQRVFDDYAALPHLLTELTEGFLQI